MNYYLRSTDELSLHLCARHQVWGFPINKCSHLQQGDQLIVYVDRELAALFEVTGNSYFDETPIWTKALYPYRVPLRLLKMVPPDSRASISQKIVRDVLYEHHTKSYAVALVLAVQPIAWEAAQVLLEQISACPNWIDYEPQTVIDSLLAEASAKHEVASEQIVQDDASAVSDERVVSTHTEMQYYLASLGKSLGYEIWIPKADQGRVHNRTKLSDLSEPEFPAMPFSEQVLRIIRNIDVIWMQYAHPTHLFEVEHTTSVYSGLLRMSDLMTMIPSMQIGMFICADDVRREKVIAEVNRPTFARKPLALQTRCRLITYDSLRTFIGGIQQDYLRHFSSTILDEISESLARQEG